MAALRTRLLAALVVPTALIAGCGGDDGDAGRTTTSRDSAAQGSDDELCTLVDADAVAGVFGGSGQFEPPTGASDRCGLVVTTASDSFTLVLTQFVLGKGAEEEFQERLDLDGRQELLNGVGDRALFDPETSLVMFVVGDARLQVAIPGRDGDRSELIEVARLVVDRLRSAG